MRARVIPLIVAGALAALGLQLMAGAAAAGDRAQAAKTVTVRVKDNFFSPKSLTVPAGTKVKFKWAGENPHNVVAKRVPRGTKKFRSSTQTSGTYSHTFGKKGGYHIECGVHGASMSLDIKAT